MFSWSVIQFMCISIKNTCFHFTTVTIRLKLIWKCLHLGVDIYMNAYCNSRLNFYTQPNNSGVDLWYHVGRPCVCLPVRLSYINSSVRPYFPFRTITSKYQWICTKLGMCTDIVEIWFGSANGQMLSIFDSVIRPLSIMSGYYRFTCLGAVAKPPSDLT